MESFPFATKHREYELSEPEDIARKYLVTQLPKFVDWKAVYHHVSNDFKPIEYRAPGVLQNYADYQQIDPQYLADVVSDPKNLKEAKKIPVFNDFVEKVNPPEGREVYCFFLHGQKNKTNIMEHIKFLSDETFEQRRLYNAITSYVVPKICQTPVLTEQIGKFIRNFSFNIPNLAFVENHEENQENEEPQDEPEEEPVEKPIVLDESVGTPYEEKLHWENPILKQFGIAAQVPKTYPRLELMKQVIVATCAPSQISLLKLGRHQLEVPDPAVESHTIADFPTNYVDFLPNDRVNAIVAHPSQQQVLRKMVEKPKSGRDWVKNIILEAHPTLGKNKELHPDIVKLLIE